MDGWQTFALAPEGTHHLRYGRPAYANRFIEVLSFHSPGVAAVRDASGACHIDPQGQAIYPTRYLRTFGFYQDRAAVQTTDAWMHILLSGQPLYPERYAWCGNFQEGRCPVRLFDRRYVHLDLNGKAVYVEQYRYAGDYREGIAVVQRDDGLHSHITTDGALLHGLWLLDLDVFHKGYARARDKYGWHHINRRGQPLYHRRFAAIEPFYNGQARVEEPDGSLLVINEQGENLVRLR
ncbi:MAG TPA: hypothetical protein VFV38_05680 [Ktedonobacteraceae bacterium]|nr:hypothetical protein [Ktedonobacteraceae bacterium]